MITAETIRQALQCGQAGCTCGRPGGNVHCPAHEDVNPSLSINEVDGKILVRCFGNCTQDRVIEALKERNLWPSGNGNGYQAATQKPHIAKSYDYPDPTGKLAFQVCRLDPKNFRQRRPDPAQPGKWIWDMKGVRRYPYRLPEVMKAETVFIVEGEKDVDNLATLGLAATCNPGGAGKWRPEYNEWLKGRNIIILPDNDPPGRAHGLSIAKSLYGIAKLVRYVELPGLSEKGDISDWLRAGGTIDQLREIVDKTPDWQPTKEPEPQAPAPEVPAKPGTTIGEQLCDVSTFISLALPDKRKILKPWLSESTINMIVGPRGVGKSSLAMGIITAATTGGAFWQWEVETQVPCLYLDGEMAGVDVQQRFAQIEALKTPGRQSLIVYCDARMVGLGLPRANLLNKKWRELMKQLLLENDVKLWVADNIASLAPGIDENSKQDWDPLNQWFLDLRFHGISTIFLHHSGKDGTQRGTSGREDNLDISISLDFPQGYTREDGCRFVCKFTKTRIPHADLPLVTDTEMWWRPDEDGVYTWLFQNIKKQVKAEVVKKLDEGVSQKDIAAELNITAARVSQLKKEAVRDGLMTEAGKLTQTGFEWTQKI
jgi:hypothetical protein